MYTPQLALPTTDGDTLLVGGAAAACQVLLIYNTSCDFCRATIPFWNELATEAGGFDVVGVSLDSLHLTRTYAETHALRYPSVVLLDARERSLLRATIVPQTLLVAADGLVLLSRPGVMTSAAMDTLRTRLTVASADRCRGAGS